jgi:hypothetical protein
VIIIQHRVNEVAKLLQTPKSLGVEVDIRSDRNQLYLAHDPFMSGTPFSEYLDNFDHAFIVLNVKEEGLEQRCLDMLNERGIKDYFFLDQSMPFLIRRGIQGAKDGACRVSEYESLGTVENLAEMCEWVWLDSFNSSQSTVAMLSRLKDLGLRICLVSPELHGSHRDGEAAEMVNEIISSNSNIDAVCTKFPEMWSRL